MSSRLSGKRIVIIGGTTVIVSYSFPSWLDYTSANPDRFGSADISETQDDAVIVALHDQLAAGLDAETLLPMPDLTLSEP